jgi:hypothetical protein
MRRQGGSREYLIRNVNASKEMLESNRLSCFGRFPWFRPSLLPSEFLDRFLLREVRLCAPMAQVTSKVFLDGAAFIGDSSGVFAGRHSGGSGGVIAGYVS